MTEELKVIHKPPLGGLKKGIAANRHSYEQEVKNINPLQVPNRLGLVIDDSGSMGEEGMNNVHTGVKNFTSSCQMTTTSIAVYPLNKEAKPLTCDYDLINVYVMGLKATGGTMLYDTLQKLIEKQNITRAIAFSDGQPTDSTVIKNEETTSDFYYARNTELAFKVVELYKQKEIPIDTIFIGLKDSSGYKELQELARLTGGTFVCFEDTKTLSSSLKYLSPRYRALLSNPEVKAKIERGEQI